MNKSLPGEQSRPDRRSWLGQVGAGLLAAGTLSLGSDSHSEAAPAVEVPTDLDIIDCHTHFYDPTRPGGIAWPTPGTPLYRTVLPKDLRALKQFRRVTGTIIVEASPKLEDNDWLLELAASDPFVVGIVGHLDPGAEGFASHVRRLARNSLFRGIRVSSSLLKEPLSSGLLADLKLLDEHSLALDVNGGPDSFAAVARLAAQLSTLRIVQNHLANVRITRDPPPAVWLAGLEAAARHPNVFCKVSALVEGAARQGETAPTDVKFYRPYLDPVWQAFGDERLIYGSNWPVSDRAADYFTLQKLVLEYVAERGPASLAKFCADNARIAYHWSERPGRR